MQQVLPPPIYIKANFSFKVADPTATPSGFRDHAYLNQPVSCFGISSLRWAHFDPLDRIGEPVQVQVDVLARTRFKFTTPALLTAEVSNDATYLGMRFQMTDFDRSRLAAAIKNEGYYPTNYIRKYPRIPGSDAIHSMPLRAIVRTPDEELIVFDIANMSPNGILLQTENPKAAALIPGTRLFAQVEPRGEIEQSFDFEGMICRLVIDKSSKTGNITRFLGIRFTRMEDSEKNVFNQVLRAVLQNIQRDGLITK